MNASESRLWRTLLALQTRPSQSSICREIARGVSRIPTCACLHWLRKELPNTAEALLWTRPVQPSIRILVGPARTSQGLATAERSCGLTASCFMHVGGQPSRAIAASCFRTPPVSYPTTCLLEAWMNGQQSTIGSLPGCVPGAAKYFTVLDLSAS